MKIMFNTYDGILVGKKRVRSYGGPGNFTKIFLKQFAEKGHELVGLNLSSDKTKDQIIEVTKKKFKDRVLFRWSTYLRVREIVESKNRSLLPGVFSTIKILSQALAKEKPDLFFLNGFSIPNWYLLRAAVLAKIPVVSVHHGLWFNEIPDISRTVTPQGIFLMNQMEKDISKLATKEVFLNEFSLKEYQRFYKIKVDKKKLKVIPLPFRNLYKKKTKKNYLPKKNALIKIGMVGRWDPIKNFQALIALAKEAFRQGKNWEFYFVSQITKNKSLKKEAKEIEKWVRIVPPMKSTELRSFYSQMALMILPSNFDVSPTVVMEALMQNRMTLISPNVGWVSLYKKFGLEQWIIDFNDPKRVIKRIETNFGAPVDKKIVSFIKKNHDPKFVFDSYEKLFKSVVKKV